MAWSYTAAQGLVSYEPPSDMQYRDGECDEVYHARIGYEASLDGAVGWEMLPGGFETVVAKDEQAPYRYLVYVNTPRCHVEMVWIPTFPDWLGFLAQYGPAATGYALQTRLQEISDLLEKCFQAWHGHDAGDLCHTCDPHGYARQMERRRQARAKG
jgi:hypothetical protein